MENFAVNISEEFRVAKSKRETLRRSFDIAHSQANSVLVFTVQWKDLEGHFDLTVKSLEKLSNDVDLKIRLLDQRAKEIESKESDLVLIEKKVKDCTVELECKEKELGLVQKRIGECNCELQLKENELNSLSESLNVKKEELSSAHEWINKCQAYQKELQLLKNLIEECGDEIELREEKVGEVQRSIEEREKQLAFKESKISSIQTLIEDYEEVLKDKEKSYDEVKKSLILCETKLECKKKELELTQSSIKELSVKFHSEEEKLELLQGKVRLHETEVESLVQMLDSMRKQQKKYSEDVELKKRELDEIRKNVEELSQDLASKDKQLKFVQQSIEECSKEFQWKKEELVSIEKQIAECSKEVELKKNQLNLIQHESNLFQTRTDGYLKELKGKEKHFDSLKKGLEDRLQDLEVKEREFQKRVKEFELREKEFDSIRKAVEDRSKNLLLQVKIEDPENLTSSGRNLQSILNQHLQKHDFIFCKVFDTIKRVSDPALLVLDAMSGFYPPHSREGDLESDVSIIRRSCILLLEQLSTIAPEINAQVREEAMKVAVEWKKKMRVAAENSLEVLGFLHLLAAYRLASAFDGKEIESLLCIVAEHRQTPKLRQTLGFADKVPGLLCSTTAEGGSSPSMLVGTSAPTNQPVPCPMNLPKYSGMNPSNSTSTPVSQYSAVQPQLGNQYKCLQRETAEGRSSPSMLVGTAAPTNQPVPCPMNLPKYSGMSPSNSTSTPVSQYSGVQPQLGNQYKRLQRETAEGRSSLSMLVGTSAPLNQSVPCPMNLPKYSGMNPSNSTSTPVTSTSAPSNQPVPCPMNLPKYSGMNPSNSTSTPVSQYSGVQPHLGNQYKRLQRETAEGRSSPSMLVGTSAPLNQPVPCPMNLPTYSGMNSSNSTSTPVTSTSAPSNQPVPCPTNLPKYSGMNPSNSTSTPVSQNSGVQPQLGNQYKRLQRETAEGRSSPSMLIGTSAPTNQLVPCPMNLPKYSEMNPSNSTSSPVSQYSGVQPQLGNQYKRVQRETAEGRSSPSTLVGTSAPTNQPVPCPMNLPKYSAMNASNSTSSSVSQYSGVQPQLENQYKRVRRETTEGMSSPSMLVGTSAPSNQPVPCPMNLPKYSGMNPSNRISTPVSQYSGVQPQLGNQYKRLQGETAEGRSSPSMLVGTSAPMSQPVPCPMNLPKYSGMNPSNRTSTPVSQYSGVQPQLGNQYKRLQRETTEGRSSPSMLVGTSAPTNQPVPCPMNLPKYSGMNLSNSTSSLVLQYSGVQPKLENQYKHPQRETIGGRSSPSMLVGISAPSNQPVPCPMNLPKYSGMNPSNRTSTPVSQNSGVQPQLGNQYKRLQRETAEGRSSPSMLVGTSAPTNQPVPCPMNIPKYSGMNSGNSTSSPVSQYSGVQPQLESQYKRLHRESPTIVAYTPPTPASDNLNRSSLATQYGPGEAHIGGQTQFGLLAANMADGELSNNKQENDPFLVHPSDSPTTVLVSPLLTGNNYGTWVRAMSMALRVRNKLGFVDGTITKPDDDDGGKWQRCNDLVSSWVLNSISTELACSVLYAQSARNLWLDLQEHFQPTNESKIYELKQAISSLRQGDMPIWLYYCKMKKLWKKLNSLQHVEPCVSGNAKVVNELQHRDFGMEFLQGLHDRYTAIRSHILLMDPLPNVQKILTLVREEETKHELHGLGGPPEAAALATQNRQPLLNSSLDNRTVHNISAESRCENLNVGSGNNQSRPTCEHCGKWGHTKLMCFALIGYPPNWKKRRRGI